MVHLLKREPLGVVAELRRRDGPRHQRAQRRGAGDVDVQHLQELPAAAAALEGEEAGEGAVGVVHEGGEAHLEAGGEPEGWPQLL